MKKTLLTTIAALMISVSASAYPACAPVAPVVVAGGSSASAPFLSFFVPVIGAFAILYLNAEGVDFPLCHEGNCYYEYPHDKNGQ